MKRKTISIGACLVVLLILGIANAADVYLEWDFQEVETREYSYVKFNNGAGAVCTDISGNGRDGLVQNSSISDVHVDRTCSPYTLPKYIAMTREDSPYGYAIGGEAIHLNDEMCVQKIYREERTGLPAGAFDTGVTMRTVLVINDDGPFTTLPQIDPGSRFSGISHTSIFKYCLEDDFALMGPTYYWRYWSTYPNPDTLWELRLADANSFELIIEPGADPCFIARVWTDSPVNGGLVSVAVPKSAIETEIGHSLIGNPVVWTMTYSVADQKLDLYADSNLVGTASTTGSTAMNTGSGAWVVGNVFSNCEFYSTGAVCNPASTWHWGINFKSIVDEVKVWDGALTATEVMCDYGQVIGVPACCADIIAAGNGYESDINEDCHVNLEDFAMLAEGWMECTPGYNCP